MTMGLVTLMWVLLGQEAEPAPAPEGEIVKTAPTPVPVTDAPPPMRRGPPDELNRLLGKLKDSSAEQRQALLDEIQKKYGLGTPTPMVPGSDIDVGKYRDLSDAEQAKVSARDFLGELFAGNASGAAAHCGVPFMMEEHRYDKPEEVRAEWARHLRSKRTDLLSLYDVEVLTPTEMEKKYGRPPQRLSSWNWRGAGVLVVVANVSGRASVLLMRQFGAVWQVVGYHD